MDNEKQNKKNTPADKPASLGKQRGRNEQKVGS